MHYASGLHPNRSSPTPIYRSPALNTARRMQRLPRDHLFSAFLLFTFGWQFWPCKQLMSALVKEALENWPQSALVCGQHACNYLNVCPDPFNLLTVPLLLQINHRPHHRSLLEQLESSPDSLWIPLSGLQRSQDGYQSGMTLIAPHINLTLLPLSIFTLSKQSKPQQLLITYF